MTALFTPPETFAGLPHGRPGAGCRAAVLGVPFDCGTHPFRVGARQGPEHVRRQSKLMRRFHVSLGDFDPLARLGAVDCGDVALVPGRVAPSFPAIEAAAGTILDAGAVPVAIGGDGSVSLPLMRAAARRHPGLVALHVDSHTDAYEYGEEDAYNAATQFSHAAAEGLVDTAHSWHVGIRGFTYCPGVLARAQGLGFRVVTTEDLFRRGFAQTVAEFRDDAAQRPVYLCWDMDVFDPSVAPGVCTPTWGGLSAREGIDLLRELSGLNIVAIDFNTVSPPQDVNDMAAHLCAHMVMEAMLLLCRQFGLAGEG
ncbi:arginase family protein [Limobrevibacterium gyesilva]|uniref:Arginase family protein n=1 Tax=Limobrevibacterium gyesilva TaxID=2991712 RepID=A0AA41YLI6_9PROT|nr:arginase family protein [Limobrevibacterium gyesilva]MCW3474148.1 arginase family protein [Limobrevibacterium gyesilva]